MPDHQYDVDRKHQKATSFLLITLELDHYQSDEVDMKWDHTLVFN